MRPIIRTHLSPSTAPLLFLTSSLLSTTVSAESLASDPFLTGESPSTGQYATAPLTGQNPAIFGFNNAWVGSGTAHSDTGLSYSDPSYEAATGGAVTTTAAGRISRQLDSVLSDKLDILADEVVYLSILANFSGGGGAWNYAAFELGDDRDDTKKTLAIGIDDEAPGEFMYQLNNGTKTSLGVPADDETHLFLLKFEMNGDVNGDALTIWVDPVLGGPGDPADGLVLTDLELLDIDDFQIGSGGPGNSFDELRFGTTLAAVTLDESLAAPSFGGLPDDYFGDFGDNVTLTIPVNGKPTPTLQWQFSSDEGAGDPWSDLPDQSHSTLTLADVRQEGFYRLVASNTQGTAESGSILIDLAYPSPTVTVPAAVAGLLGEELTIPANASGLGSLSYSWYRLEDGIEVELGQTGSTLTFPSLSASDLGTYFVKVTDDGSGVTPHELPAETYSADILVVEGGQPAYEPFLIGEDPDAGQYLVQSFSGQGPDVLGFFDVWGGGGALPTAAAGSLSYSDPNYASPAGGSLLTGQGGRIYRPLSPSLSGLMGAGAEGTIYLSILANFSGGLGTWGYAAFELGQDGSDPQKSLAIGIDSSIPDNFMYQINNGTKMDLGIAADSATHLFLLKLDLRASDPDTLTVWVDPVLGGGGDPADGIVLTGFDLLPIEDFQVGSGAAGNQFDEVRIAPTLAEVTSLYLGPEGETFASWMTGFPGVGSETAFSDDADQDGLANGLEAFLGTDPSEPNDSLEAVMITEAGLTFQHPRTATVLLDVQASYQWSSDLQNWFASGEESEGSAVTFQTLANTPATGTSSITAEVTGVPLDKVFVRLQVQQTGN
ncbi:immunoglobulin domain-containing protein [Roseibacillus ishigakijimensis]|uniref:Immunoglobulin domain-containing protein n=1 Tax=Roseibacillus ishigakijimensis TaxID=454146 RepID=A0A934RPX2_9BACT|nr:immunoglobulin domain-containing protein [Roseibacillus ishigakijimensis]MBK1834805.1 immunoglobulin domain-containing protein [Roseibacillus ishigakijimensis]